VSASGVVEAFDEVKDGEPCFGSRLEGLAVDELALDTRQCRSTTSRRHHALELAARAGWRWSLHSVTPSSRKRNPYPYGPVIALDAPQFI
jgi:hypothetical protein